MGITVVELMEDAERIQQRAWRADEQIADDIAANPDLYDLAANKDENKDPEAKTPRD